MSYTVERKRIIALCIIAAIFVFAIFCAIKAAHKSSVSFSPVEKELNAAWVLSPEANKAMKDLTTKGNWTFIPTNYRNYNLCFNFSSIPEILDRFEKEQNLDIKNWEIVYSSYPHDGHLKGLLIHHAPK